MAAGWPDTETGRNGEHGCAGVAPTVFMALDQLKTVSFLGGTWRTRKGSRVRILIPAEAQSRISAQVSAASDSNQRTVLGTSPLCETEDVAKKMRHLGS